MRTVCSFLRYGAFLSLPHGFGIHHYFIRYASVCLGCLSWLHQWEYHIALVDFIGSSRGQIRKLRLALVVCIVFSKIEYHIALVDFIGSSRGRLERDRGFANPLSLSNTSPDPWGYPLRRGMTAAAGLYQFRYLVSGASRLSPGANIVQLSVFGLVSLAFQLGCWACIARFSLLGGGTVCACGYVKFGYSLL